MAIILVPILQLISLVFVARALLSWFPIGPDSTIYPVRRFLHGVTEPVLAPVRRMLPRTGRIDLSVLAVVLVISFVLTPIASIL